MSKKKVGIVIGVVAVAAVVVGGLYFSGVIGGKGGSSADKVYVEKVSTVMNQGTGANNRYSGVVEPQETWEVNKDESRTISQVFVEEGDEVEAGGQLFEYDTADIELQIQQATLELENIDNEIANFNSQIAELQAEKAAAAAEQQFEYTTQIQTVQTSIKQSDYDKKSKQAEIEKLQKSKDNSIVTSKIAGVVKSINDTGMDEMGNSAAYMTILATGEYQIKGTINEQNVGMITEGQAVLVRSRVDETITWNGTINKIDTENTVTSNSDSMYSSDDSGDDTTTSTKYPFYVTLDSMDGLMLGQHVYIELDMGQTEVKEGVWLYSYYIVMDDPEHPYVWVANSKNKLEKRDVTLGEYDADLDEYEITDGLTAEELISWPMPGLYEGVTTVTNAEDVDYDAPLYNQESTEGGMMDGGESMDGGDMMLDSEMMYDDAVYNTEVEMMPEEGMDVESQEGMDDAAAEGAEVSE